MREWLTVIIVLLIAGILLDGLRRMRRARRENLRISRKARDLNPDDFPEVGSEICSQPRVVSYRDRRDAENLTKSVRESFARSRVTVGAPRRIPQQVALNLQEAVPMLMDSVDEPQAAEPPRRDYTQAPSWAEPKSRKSEPKHVPEPEYEGDEHEEAAWDTDEPALGSMDTLAESDRADEQPAFSYIDDADELDSAPAGESGKDSSSSKKAEESHIEPEEVLIINLMAPAGYRFEGSELRDALLDHGLRFGAMNIFHRHKNSDGSGPVRFSLANMVVPGTFDLSSMENFSTPGVSMFLSLPNEDNSLEAFDCMAETAKGLAQVLGGELKDENRSVMTRQTLEHCRQRVVEFERKKRLMQHS